MRTGKKLALILVGLVLYILVMNIVAASMNYSAAEEQRNRSALSGGAVELGVGDSISVSVVRERFYGVYHIANGDNNLYLFWLIKIPIDVNEVSFVWIHWLFLVCCGITWWSLSEEKVYKDENTYFAYEELA